MAYVQQRLDRWGLGRGESGWLLNAIVVPAHALLCLGAVETPPKHAILFVVGFCKLRALKKKRRRGRRWHVDRVDPCCCSSWQVVRQQQGLSQGSVDRVLHGGGHGMARGVGSAALCRWVSWWVGLPLLGDLAP
jgi:hypothetical protein